MNRAARNQATLFDSKVFFAVVGLAALTFVLIPAAAAPPPGRPAPAAARPQQSAAADSDKTLAAMQDELERSRARL